MVLDIDPLDDIIISSDHIVYQLDVVLLHNGVNCIKMFICERDATPKLISLILLLRHYVLQQLEIAVLRYGLFNLGQKSVEY